jgi:signal transduction histidine kinase
MCLYSISKIAEQPGLSLEEITKRIVSLLPPSWQFPEIACGRITIDGASYTTERFEQKGPSLRSEIVVDGKKRGEVEVIYNPKGKPQIELSFLPEERKLINEVARQIALFIERKQAEEEKRQLQEQIRHADRLATIGQLSAGIAHELNEPLNNIIGYAQLTAKNRDLSGQIREDMEKIVKASLYAREVMRKLLFFARQMPSRKSKVDLNEVVREGLDFLQSQVLNRGLTLDYRPAPNLPQVTADSSQFTQVVVNLVVNAIQAMDKGGVLTVLTKADKSSVYLTVEDTGTGISQQIRDRIFLPFFTTKDANQGTGLGLAVVHGIVTSHGGSISVSSREGEGSRFEVRLPLHAGKI